MRRIARQPRHWHTGVFVRTHRLPMTRPIRATIRTSALRNNLEIARRHAPNAQQMAVIKANAYGHGLLRAAQALCAADGFAVLDLAAAVCLRNAGFAQPILLLEGFFEPGELPVIAREKFSVVVHCEEQLEILLGTRTIERVSVFVKLNTGMNRLGFEPGQLPRLLQRLRAARQVGELTLMTHFANADDARGVDWQLQRFDAATREFDLPVSLANSATLLRHPQAARGWARVGLMLYGASPLPDRPAAQLGLRPAMTLESRIIAVRELAAGERIGYGGAFTAPEAMRMGVVACGYADGYPRHAPSGAPVLVAGRRTGTLGRVSMDMLCVDLSGLPDAGVGAPVVLWGEGLPVEEVAAAAGTVAYELLCALAPRVPVQDGD